MFNLISGGAVLLASVIAGSLWSVFGASATFIAGASFAALAAMGLLLYRPRVRAAGRQPFCDTGTGDPHARA
jgi:membrane protein implicated in regulation of membrane protease activity